MRKAFDRNKYRRPAMVLFLLMLALAILLITFGTKQTTHDEESSNVELSSPVQSSLVSSAANSVIETSEDIASSEQPPEEVSEVETWKLVLVNAENPLPDDFVPELEELSDGYLFDKRAIGALKAMLSAAKEEGLSPVIASSYRSISHQRGLFENRIAKEIDKGYNRTQAEENTIRAIAYPGTSEHHLGLAADIVSSSYQTLDPKQMDTPESKWLRKHCADYGFILRYPLGKEEITGVMYEAWHFRYVGEETAKEIMESGLCLEEYLR